MSAFIEKLRTFLHGAETDVEAVRAELKNEVKKILAELREEDWHPNLKKVEEEAKQQPQAAKDSASS